MEESFDNMITLWVFADFSPRFQLVQQTDVVQDEGGGKRLENFCVWNEPNSAKDVDNILNVNKFCKSGTKGIQLISLQLTVM